MRHQQFDNVAKEWVYFEPLHEKSTRIVSRGLGDQARHKVMMAGTCGDPSAPDFESHREDLLIPILRDHYQIPRSSLDNPEVAEWDLSRVFTEGAWFARDKVLSIPVTNKTAGAAGVAEGGLGAYGAVLRGQYADILIELNDESPGATRTARELALTVLQATQAENPMFSVSSDIVAHAHQVGGRFKEMELLRKAAENHGVDEQPREYTLPPIRGDLLPEIYLSGSSGVTKPAWMTRISDKIKAMKDDTVVNDSYREKWTERDIGPELLSKLNCAVQIEVIDSDTAALGALAETGPRVMDADFSGKSYGLLITDEFKGDPSDVATKDSNRTRALVKKHIEYLQKDFNNLPVFVTDSMDDLALFAVGHYVEQKERLDRQE